MLFLHVYTTSESRKPRLGRYVLRVPYLTILPSNKRTDRLIEQKILKQLNFYVFTDLAFLGRYIMPS